MRFFLAVFITLLISGCDKRDTQQSTTLGNQEVNCLNVELGITNDELMQRVSSRKKTHDLDLLKRIHLPANASLCERRDFVDLILYASQNQSSYMKIDPQVRMIMLAIKGYEDQFLSLMNNWHSANAYVKYALIELLGDVNKKDFVKKNIDKHPLLIQVVVNSGWSKEFKKEVEDIITKHNGKVSYNYGAALAQINDPSTAHLILSIFKNGTGNRHVTYSFIKKLEWFDPKPVMKEIWMSDDVSDLELQYFSYPLLRSGFFPALDYTVSHIDGYANNSAYHKNHDVLNAITNHSLNKDEIKSWVVENRSKLKFDATSKKYYVAQ